MREGHERLSVGVARASRHPRRATHAVIREQQQRQHRVGREGTLVRQVLEREDRA